MVLTAALSMKCSAKHWEKTLPERFLSYRSDLIGEIWSDRPALSAEPVWILDAKYTGESAAERLAKVREKMKENGAEVHILTALDDIAWMLISVETIFHATRLFSPISY